ncbi:TetR family transcriptional regulator C-terminal domain-containing protein [Rhodococcus fascians]|nr:TetR family transcriptional regulator C-terminal domain-containing protein [Rhodococcus fascians]MBY4136796.1 TetR family transcriptional regulator C-terminal domain-containing protein [Rhodococcus fascians]MBY4218626.1 TetR family transcriptional regulator C-terminal domain-containing protein [Rhodococcus fascians]MBY4221660.1 TetR family transcriptional regulator C-terminal domain-containing protein [Rhodococcus fascians]MBY4227749.1 TetR family transcriptional regulator C-terminal domain-
MPKIVDHDARRAEIVAAVWRVIERAGMNGATVRSVAAEAGVSPGSLRYYFSDQGELVLFAAEAMTQRVVHRLEEHPAGGDGLVRAIRVLEELLPLDEDRRAEASVWLEALVRARIDERLAALKRAGWFGSRYLCRLAWAHLHDLDRPDSPAFTFDSTVDEYAAAELHTYIDGLTLQAVTYPEQLTADEVRRLLRTYLEPQS